MLDLALPEGKVWDDLRRHFARFHARCLAWCLSSSDPADRALVPRILAAVQGRRLAAEALEQAMALGDAAAPEIRDVLAIKAEMRALLEELGAAEGSYGAGSPGRDGTGPSGTRGGGDAAAGFGQPPRDADRIAAIRSQLQAARDRLAAAKRTAAKLPEFSILAAPLAGIGTAALTATLAPDEALVLAFPLPEDKAKPRASSTVSETEEEATSSTPVWLWALRSDGSDPVVLRVGAGATEDAPSSLPDWAGSLPGVVDRWEQFSEAMGGRGGVRRGDLDRGDAAGMIPVEAGDTDMILSPAEMSSFWSDIDAALAALVWEPLAATGVLDGVADILIATAGSLHNLPFSVGRRGAAAEARLLHQSSLASFARSRGLFGARPVAPETLANVRAIGMRAPDGIAARPAVTLLAAQEDAPGQEIPLARAERRIAARIWAAAGAKVWLANDYPLDPDAPVALAHAACHGTIATPKGGTPGAHLLLQSTVSERTLLAGKPAGAWLMGACVGGRVHDDALDGNPTGIVAGALSAGTETVVAALPPLPDREAFFFGVLVTLMLAHPSLGAADPEHNGPTTETDGPVDLVTAAALAAALVGGAREVTEVERVLPRRTLAALGGRDALARRLVWLDAGLRWALAEELAETQGAALTAAMTSGRADGSAVPLPRPQRKGRIVDALISADPTLALCRAGRSERSGALPARVTLSLAQALAAPANVETCKEAFAGSDPGKRLADLLTRALLSLPGAFAVLPDPADPTEHDPAAQGAIAHGIVTFHDPRPKTLN
jgi:hypothetical protein